MGLSLYVYLSFFLCIHLSLSDSNHSHWRDPAVASHATSMTSSPDLQWHAHAWPSSDNELSSSPLKYFQHFKSDTEWDHKSEGRHMWVHRYLLCGCSSQGAVFSMKRISFPNISRRSWFLMENPGNSYWWTCWEQEGTHRTLSVHQLVGYDVYANL